MGEFILNLNSSNISKHIFFLNMDFRTVSSNIPNNYSISTEVFLGQSQQLLLIESSASCLPWLLIGPMIHILTSLLLLPFTPSSAMDSDSKRCKWRMTLVARLTAAITGSSAVMVLYSSPSLQADLMLTSSVSAQQLIHFSLGVHIAEAADMLIKSKPSMLLVHHLLVILCFSGALLTEKAVGFAVLSLITEVNAVFNKTRILHIITSTDKDSMEYKINALLNIFTFFLRILIMGWMNNQCFLYLDVLPLPFLLSCAAGILIVNIWNLSVFRTLVQKDILGKHKQS